jgi:hypothetical protein
MVYYTGMNDVAARIGAMEEEIKQLRDMLAQVLRAVEDNKQAVTQFVQTVRPSDEVTEEDLFANAYEAFGITSEANRDDNLIAPNVIVKPIDWSCYA